jgi:hypothetical protein
VDFQLPCLGFVEDLTDEVHRMLDGPGPPGGVWRVHLHWCRPRELLALCAWREL